MSLATQITGLATRIGTEFKTVYGKVGDLTSLTTTAKGSLVAALNEVKASSGSGLAINDTADSTTAVNSSSKVTAKIAAATSALVGGAPAQLDALNEFAAALGNDANFAATTATALGNRATTAAVGDTTTDFAGQFVTALS